MARSVRPVSRAPVASARLSSPPSADTLAGMGGDVFKFDEARTDLERVLGKIPERATHYALRRQVDGRWVQCGAAPQNAAVKAFQWPLVELDPELIRSRFGNGVFRTQWIGPRADGKPGTQNYGQGKQFEIDTQPTAPASVGPAVAPAEPMQDSLRMVDELLARAEDRAERQRARDDSRVSSQVRDLVLLSQQMGGTNRSSELAVLQQQINQQTQALSALAQSIQVLAQRVEAGPVEEDDEDEDDENGQEQPEGSDAPMVTIDPSAPVGEQAKAQLANMAIQAMPMLLSGFVEWLGKQQPPAPAPAPTAPAPPEPAPAPATVSTPPPASSPPLVADSGEHEPVAVAS